VVAFGVLNICIGTMGDPKYFVHMLFDSASLTFPFICVGLYTDLPLQIVQLIASLPFLFMIFFSTTFSPGAGVEAVKELRFLFARFYFWCDLPGFKGLMDSCPADNLLVPYSILSGCLGLFLFLAVFFSLKLKAKREIGVRGQARAKVEEVRSDKERSDGRSVATTVYCISLKLSTSHSSLRSSQSEPFQKLQQQLFGANLIASLTASKSPKSGKGFELVPTKGEESI